MLFAPAGCGKTDFLAQHAALLIERGSVRPPQQLLALTFTHRAKANLRSRMVRYAGRGLTDRRTAVTNFHGLAARLYRHHASVIGADPEITMPQRGALLRLRRQVAEEHGCPPSDIADQVRRAKQAVGIEEDPMTELQAGGHSAAVAYEIALRSSGRLDFDDLIRAGAQLLQVPAVLRLYRARFRFVIVDEAQDLSRMQFELVDGLSKGRSLFAGDRAQGIFSFAGAEPQMVFDRILERSPTVVELERSHRSSPAVLAVVSALAAELGGRPIESADPERWVGRGKVGVLKVNSVFDEAEYLVDMAQRWTDEHPDGSLGIIARTANRRRHVDRAIEAAGLAAEQWDLPIHSPTIVGLLRRHVRDVCALPGSDRDRLQELYLRALVELPSDDIEAQDELVEATQGLEASIEESTLAGAIAGIRIVGDPDEPAAPGVHLLNGHLGKGQQFTRVVIVGMEEAFIPNYPAIASGNPEQVREELAVLHVMASRAEEDLLFTCSGTVPTTTGRSMDREPCRWLPLIEPHAQLITR